MQRRHARRPQPPAITDLAPDLGGADRLDRHQAALPQGGAPGPSSLCLAAYIADVVRPVYVECAAEWDDDLATKRRVWELYQAAPPPLGYDPAPIFHAVEHPDFGVLKLSPWRIELGDMMGRQSRVWRA